jgi:hypothetical protein
MTTKTLFIPIALALVIATPASADMRGNTDESWSRATSYLVCNRLLAPNYGAAQAQ